jgi:aryl-alcohol dehydrogenase
MTVKATAAVAYQPDTDFVLEEVTLDDLRPNELLVKIEAVGICHTDATLKHLLPLPAVFGHEGVGIVEKTGAEVSYAQAGDRVIISYPHCGSCSHCEEHQPALCDHFVPLAMSGARLDGSATIFLRGEPITSAFFSQSSFATHAITTESNVVKLNEDVTDPQKYAALPCGIVTGAGAMLNTLDIQKGQSLVVFGAGAVGLSAVMAAHSRGASPIIVVDVVEERLQLAKELGASHTVDGRAEDVAAQVKAITGNGAECVFDTSGHPAAFNNAIASAKKGARMAIVTAPNIGGTFEFDGMAFLSQALTLIGVQMGGSITKEFIPHLIQLNKEGNFPYEKLITYYQFDQINQAFEDSHKGKAIKPILVMPKD